MGGEQGRKRSRSAREQKHDDGPSDDAGEKCAAMYSRGTAGSFVKSAEVVNAAPPLVRRSTDRYINIETVFVTVASTYVSTVIYSCVYIYRYLLDLCIYMRAARILPLTCTFACLLVCLLVGWLLLSHIIIFAMLLS